jgi:hypothetical protein
MYNKAEILAMLQDEFNRWEKLLNGLSVQQITAANFLSDWSIKDTLAHLMAWQKRSIARLEAAQLKKEPIYPKWPAGPADETDDTERINAWIYQTYRDHPWPSVHRAWRTGFLRFLELVKAIPEIDLLEPGKYAWLDGQPLSEVLIGSYEHHHFDHLEPLLALLHPDK